MRNVNAQELALMVGTTRQTISNLRRGATARTHIEIARGIADALAMNPDHLFVMPRPARANAADEDDVA